MAIALDNTSSSANQTGSSVTFSHTCAGDNRLLVVGVSIADNADTVSGITYNGVALTLIDAIDVPNTSRRVELWYLIAPATGANNVIVTLSGTPTNFFNVGVASYTGSNQSSPVDISGKYSADVDTNMTKSVTTVRDNDWLVGILCNGAALDPTANAGTTLRLSVYNRTGNGYELFFLDSNGAKTPPGSYALGVTATSGGGAIVVAAIKPFLEISTSDTSSSSDSITREIAMTPIDTVTGTEDVDSRFGWSSESKSSAPTWNNQEKT